MMMRRWGHCRNGRTSLQPARPTEPMAYLAHHPKYANTINVQYFVFEVL